MTYYDKQGRAITLEEFAELFEDLVYRKVDWDEIEGGMVSTVWLGIDHGFGGRVLIFETMVFVNGDPKDCSRYSTLPEALEGHKRMVKLWKDKKFGSSTSL